MEAASPATLAGRMALWCALVGWTLAFAAHGVATNYAGESVLHLVNLVFHEAGHVVLSPFGRFVMVAGGSLFQVLVPIACAWSLARSANAFGTGVATWWAGQNLVDIAPYVNDARSLQLVLLGGRTGAEVEGHDWEYLLTTLGWAHLDHRLAQAMHLVGLMAMAGALVWSAFVLVGQARAARAAPREPAITRARASTPSSLPRDRAGA